MNWYTFPMGGAATERNATAHLSHAVDLDAMKPLCNRVKVTSLVIDKSLCSPGELPDCLACLTVLAKVEADRLRALGWGKQDFAQALKKELEG